MSDAIVIKLEARGVQELVGSFRTVQQTVLGFERDIAAGVERGSRIRTDATNREAKERQKATEKLAKDNERVERDATRAAEKAEREKTRAVETEERRKQQIRERSATMAGQYARQEADAEIRERRRVQQARDSFERNIGGAALRGLGNGVRNGIGAGMWGVGVAGGMLNRAMSVGGGFSLADSVQTAGELQKSAALLSNSAVGVAGVTSQQADPAKIVAKARAASIATGIDANEIIKATRGYVAKASDFKGGMENMEFFAKVAQGTGTNIEDVTSAMGMIRSQNKDLGADEAKKMLLAMVMQGKQGSIEMDKLAGSAGKITRSATSYAGDQSETQQKLLGLAQIAVRTGATAPAAAITLSSIGSDIRGHHDAISKKLGYQVVDKSGKITKAPEEVLADLMAATGGSAVALGQHGGLGFTKPSLKMFEALSPGFDKAKAEFLMTHAGDEKGANKAGAAAALAEMRDVTGQTMKGSDLDQMVQKVLNTPTEQFAAALRNLKEELGAELLPQFTRLAGAVREMTPTILAVVKSLTGLAEWLAQNPIKSAFLGLGAIVSKAIVGEIASAMIAEQIKKILGGVAGGAGAPGAAGGGAGGATAAGVVAGGAAMVVATGKFAHDTGKAILGGSEAGADIAAMLRSNDPATRAKGETMLKGMRDESGSGKLGAGIVGRLTTLGQIASGPLGAATSLATDAALSAAGLTTESQRSNKAIGAQVAVSSVPPELTEAGKIQLEAARMQLEAAKTAASSASPGGPGSNSPARSQPLSAPARGGPTR